MLDFVVLCCVVYCFCFTLLASVRLASGCFFCVVLCWCIFG
jgi:hypothetical protein